MWWYLVELRWQQPGNHRYRKIGGQKEGHQEGCWGPPREVDCHWHHVRHRMRQYDCCLDCLQMNPPSLSSSHTKHTKFIIFLLLFSSFIFWYIFIRFFLFVIIENKKVLILLFIGVYWGCFELRRRCFGGMEKKVDFLLMIGKWGSGIIIFKSFYENGSV